jgi:hypothetical protein
MRARGINYDTGFFNAGTSTHEPFDPEVVRREMRVIRDDLHCTAVRITGGDPDRLEIAATHDAHLDLDTASAGVVKVLDSGRGERYPDMPWEPKAAFDALADCYGRRPRAVPNA